MIKKSPLSGVLAAAGLCALTPLAPAATRDVTDAPPAANAESAAAAADAAQVAAERAASEAQLQAAQKQLEEAARKIAELSTRGMFDGRGLSQAIIGAQLERAGKDGLRVQGVSPGGPAAAAGLKSGDVIISINGIDARGEDAGREVLRSLREVKPDTKVSVKVLREGREVTLALTARAAPRFYFSDGRLPPMAAIPPIPPLPSLPQIPPVPPLPPLPAFGWGPLGDMELATLTAHLGHYFGTEKGVLVVRGPQGGALGLQDGDVILSIDGREVEGSAQAARILGSYETGEKVTLRIMRDRKAQTLEAAVPARVPHGRRDYHREDGPRGDGPGPGGGGGPGPARDDRRGPPPPQVL